MSYQQYEPPMQYVGAAPSTGITRAKAQTNLTIGVSALAVVGGIAAWYAFGKGVGWGAKKVRAKSGKSAKSAKSAKPRKR